jgi:hypothetical protein
MVDRDDDKEAAPDGANPVTPPSGADDAVDETEMTSIMGPEERRVLLSAARDELEATPQEVAREEDFARPTARPPGTVGEPGVTLPAAPRVPVFGDPPETPDSAARPQVRRETDARVWVWVAFVALAAAVAYVLMS